MGIIGIIFLVFVLFIIFGLGGWLLEIIGHIFGFLIEGCYKSLGCLIWVLVIIAIIAVIGGF